MGCLNTQDETTTTLRNNATISQSTWSNIPDDRIFCNITVKTSILQTTSGLNCYFILNTH